jgi:hypothetical protein
MLRNFKQYQIRLCATCKFTPFFEKVRLTSHNASHKTLSVEHCQMIENDYNKQEAFSREPAKEFTMAKLTC